jgi:hypothetical protein
MQLLWTKRQKVVLTVGKKKTPLRALMETARVNHHYLILIAIMTNQNHRFHLYRLRQTKCDNLLICCYPGNKLFLPITCGKDVGREEFHHINLRKL